MREAWRATLTGCLTAAWVILAQFGMAPAGRLVTPPPIVVTARPALAGEVVRRQRGGREERWVVARTLEITGAPSLN